MLSHIFHFLITKFCSQFCSNSYFWFDLDPLEIKKYIDDCVEVVLNHDMAEVDSTVTYEAVFEMDQDKQFSNVRCNDDI